MSGVFAIPISINVGQLVFFPERLFEPLKTVYAWDEEGYFVKKGRLQMVK